ncbi:MAG: MMPL family transporter [Paludibacteraceae bacterium]|nr:MMPL family transporter [Paludibacteraceae bacterium]
MTKLTTSIYYFFKKNRLVFWATLILSTLFFVYFGTKIKYEEDVTKLLPSTKDKDNTKEVVFENLKVKDKLFIIFKPTSDTTDVSRTSTSIDTFMNRLLVNPICKEMLDESLYRVDADLLKNAIGELYNQLPIFIDSTDYKIIDSLTTKEAISQQMQENLMTIYSPTGSMMMDVIFKDPLAFRKVFMNKASSLKEGLGSNYKIIDNHFFSPDSAIAIVWLSPNFKTLDSKLSSKLINEIDNEIEEYNKLYPDVEVYYHGAAPQSVFNAKQIKSDLFMTLSVSMLIICIILLLCYRDPKFILQMAVPIGYGFFFSLTVIYFIKEQISLLALGIGAIVLGVALSYCLHVLIHKKYVNDPVRVIKEQTVPVILGSLTTIGAFLSLLFTRAELLKDFGIFASLALVGTTLFCLIFLPQFFGTDKKEPSKKILSILNKINSYPFERKTLLICGITFISILSFFTSDWVKFDTNIRHLSHYEPKVIESQKILAEHTTKGYQTMYFAATSESLDTALYYNRQMTKMLDALEDLGKIGSFTGNNNQIFLLNSEQQERIDAWNKYWTPTKKAQVLTDMDQAAVACGFTPDSLNAFRHLIEYTNYQPFSIYESKALPEAIKCNLMEYTDGKYLVFTPVLLKEEYKTEVCDEITSHKHLVVIDPFYYTSDMLELIHKDFNVTLGLSSLFVLIVLLIAYKSFILAFISFLPMTLSWYIVLGVMGIFGIEFNLINIIVSSFIYGVGVDYSIFIMDGLLAEYRTKKNLLVFHKTAILFSAMVLIITVTSLLFAHHPSVRSIGVSTLIGMSSALLIAYTLQPFLFYWLIKRQAGKGVAPITLFNIMHGEIYFNKKKSMSNKQQIRNIYEYKGYDVEKTVKNELKITHNYSILNDLFPMEGRMLDYNCNYGAKAYWFHINTTDMQIVGYDKNENAITIANNCYSKDDRIKFTTNEAILEEKFDAIAINPTDDAIPEAFKDCMESARIILLHKEMVGKIQVPTKFQKKDEDERFILYKA